MIIPWLKGFLSWTRVPLTWTLVFLNIFIFILTYQPEQRALSSLFSSREELVLTGRLYDQYRLRNNDDPWQHRQKTQDEYILLGSQGLRDPDFAKQAEAFKFNGDEIAISEWKKSVIKFQEKMHERSSYLFGLVNYEGGKVARRPLTWVTYQFMHAGIVHLASNMVLLLIFAAGLELLIGGIGVVLLYIISGIAGGLGFLVLSQFSIAPMVGASGALSGVMACYAALESKRRVPFFYFLSPIRGYYGIIHLPTWLIFPLCFLTDIASYLSTPAELGSGVAYTAHIGGALFGALVGFSLKALKFRLPQKYPIKPSDPPQGQSPV
jgi:membrane associated rhomboid family serine protease